MAELTDQQILERAEHAKRILDDELFAETVLMAEEAVVARWRMSSDTETREEAWHELQGLQRVMQMLRGMFDDADFLKDQLEKQKRHEQ